MGRRIQKGEPSIFETVISILEQKHNESNKRNMPALLKKPG